ncbi:NADPH:quinone oxidoreductase family protein [Nocardia nova]|uniref:NADPH:quinone oxidoreductase family protein n=1 Tax=Nocardia nova TaxID=37330 RepID=UPI0018932352|nr:NADPH:quinone oxidoreductase family protein [Nocardia nova]MBF6149558.1 NADPH:quinone oxidoreductase family protein [Nocardia nova]
MEAVEATALSGPSALRVASVPVPDGNGKVLVAVRTVGVNFPDLLMTYGKYQLRASPPFVPGVEVAGVVVSAPAGTAFSPGDEVVAFCPELGGYSEFVAVAPEMVAAKPPELDFAEAAALPANFQTVHFAMTQRAIVRPGQSVLVLGGAGGIGTAAIQIAKALGATVIAVTRRQGVAQRLTELGADHVVALVPGWAQRVRDITGGAGVDHVLDPIGGAAFDEAIRALATEGNLFVIGFASGDGIPTLKVNRLLLRNIAVTGVAWGEYMQTRPTAFAKSMAALSDLAAAGFRPYVSARYSLSEAGAALTALERGAIVGKAVIEVPSTT